MGLPTDARSDVPAPMADRLEHHVRRLGIPLRAAEAVAESIEAAEGFLAACEAGRGRAYAARLQAGDDGDGDADETDEAPDDPVVRVRVALDPWGRGRRGGGTAARQA